MKNITRHYQKYAKQFQKKKFNFRDPGEQKLNKVMKNELVAQRVEEVVETAGIDFFDDLDQADEVIHEKPTKKRT